MVIFSGKIDSLIQQNIINNRSKQLSILVIIACCIAMIIGVPCMIVENNYRLLSFMILDVIVIFIFILYLVLPIHRIKFGWDTIVKIGNNEIEEILIHSNYSSHVYKTSKVKKIYDNGSYYYICFNRWDISKGIVCQRNLIIEGTIEEFEKLFEGKIVRKKCKH